MLQRLQISNLALVDRVEINFEEGLNMITGETGAGKSLLIGALKLVLGERGDKDLIRSGEDRARIEAVFQLSDPERVNGILEDCGMEPCQDGELIVRRVVKSSGSSKSFLNDSTVKLQTLRAIGEHLVDMHGPHDHQSLLSQEIQLDILDSFGHLGDERATYNARYREMGGLNKKIADLQGVDEEAIAERIEFLSYRLEEIREAKLDAEEEREIAREHEFVGNARNIIESANKVVTALGESDGSATDSLSIAQRNLGEMARLMPEAEEWQDELENAFTQIQDVISSIEIKIGDLDASPERMEWLDERLTTYQTLKRKYGPSLEDLLAKAEEWEQTLQDLQSRDEQCSKLVAEREVAQKRLLKYGKKLSAERRKTAQKLSRAITAELHDLGFERGNFEVKLLEQEPGPKGLERADYGFAPNLGEEMRPLRAIASSGEISRVMLAVKSVLSRHDRIPLLVFDEIDANLGGGLGGAVGHKLHQVSRAHQILCITHLPQVAAFGGTHFAVDKSVSEGRTYTRVGLLNEENRTTELARMLGGEDPGSAARKHARELLEESRADTVGEESFAKKKKREGLLL